MDLNKILMLVIFCGLDTSKIVVRMNNNLKTHQSLILVIELASCA